MIGWDLTSALALLALTPGQAASPALPPTAPPAEQGVATPDAAPPPATPAPPPAPPAASPPPLANPSVPATEVPLSTAPAPVDGPAAVPSDSSATAPPAPPPLPAPGSADQDVVVVGNRSQAVPGDPLANVNIQTFRVTQSVDKAFVRPVSVVYRRALPKPVRSGLRNALRNLDAPVTFLNYLLQLKPGKAAETVGRFAVNSTIGVAGLVDVARKRPFGLPYRRNGFANTLGYYGVKPGAYLFLPLLGSITVRDLFGYAVDRAVLPVAVGTPFNRIEFGLPTTTIRALDYRVEFDDQLRALHEDNASPYATSREFYLRSRQAEIDALHGKATPMPVVPVAP